MNTIEITIADVKLFVTETEKNIQINDIPAATFGLVWGHVKAQYPGYEVFFSFNSERMTPNQQVPATQLTEIGVNRIDDMLNFKLQQADFNLNNYQNELEIILLTDATFAEFAAFHDARNPGMYWTSARLQKRPDLWQIHTLTTNGQLTGYVMTMFAPSNTEIFAIESDDLVTFEALLTTACQNAFTLGRKEVLYMLDATVATSHQQTVKELGFNKTGFYQGFQIQL